MLLPPYNEFFKVGVSESGNHDNNIYNQNWSEQYHGLKIIAKSGGRGGVVQAGAATDGSGETDGAAAAAAASGRGRGARGSAPNPRTSSKARSAPTTRRTPSRSTSRRRSISRRTSKGNLLLETGDMDNNVHPANTIRLVNALIKANKRFDFMLLPGKPHGYGDDTPYTNHLMFEYFSEHLLGDYYRQNATINDK